MTLHNSLDILGKHCREIQCHNLYNFSYLDVAFSFAFMKQRVGFSSCV